jgi:hypothetical protein
MTWRESVATAIRRLAARKGNKMFTRQELIDSEFDRIKREVGFTGKTPGQTLGRVLQELRDEGMIAFVTKGVYRLIR